MFVLAKVPECNNSFLVKWSLLKLKWAEQSTRGAGAFEKSSQEHPVGAQTVTSFLMFD